MNKQWPAATVEHVDYDTHHDERANVFIQWKGTEVCFDFWCECGQQGHYDGFFAYVIECPACGSKFEMPNTVYPLKRDPADVADCPTVRVEADEDELSATVESWFEMIDERVREIEWATRNDAMSHSRWAPDDLYQRIMGANDRPDALPAADQDGEPPAHDS